MITTTLLSIVLLSTTSNTFLDAICKVESNCNPSAVGDNGNAIGAYQIWKSYWKDAIEHDPSEIVGRCAEGVQVRRTFRE